MRIRVPINSLKLSPDQRQHILKNIRRILRVAHNPRYNAYHALFYRTDQSFIQLIAFFHHYHPRFETRLINLVLNSYNVRACENV